MVDRHLLDALIAKAEHYQARVPVHRVENLSLEQSARRAARLGESVWGLTGDCAPQLVAVEFGMARLAMSEDRQIHVYPASGAVDAFVSSARVRDPLALDECKAERPEIQARLKQLAEGLAKQLIRGGDEELKPEKIWETKAKGQSLRGEHTPTALLEVVGTMRRYLHGLPVLGRASLHVGLGAAMSLSRWGVDFRPHDSKVFDQAHVLAPAEAAQRILARLQTRRPGHTLTLKEHEPEFFKLGYVSLPRRRSQGVLQPAWVASFRPRGQTSMGVVLAIPAAPAAYESIELAPPGAHVGTLGRGLVGAAPDR